MRLSSRAGKVFCLHCDWPLKRHVDSTGYVCGVCSTIYDAATVNEARMAGLSSEEREQENIETARTLLQAADMSRPEVAMVSVDDVGISTWKRWLSLFGVPVEEEAYATNLFPFVGFVFMFACFGLFLRGPEVMSQFAADPKDLGRLGGLTLLTYAFVHGNFAHLIGNMFFVWPFLDNVEEHLGHIRALSLIVVSAVVSAVAHLLFDHSGLPLVGASGVCFAVATLYCLRYPRHRFLVAVPILGFWAYRFRLRVRARTLFGFFILKELLGAYAQSSGMTSVSHYGHLGGALTGLLFYLLFQSSGNET